MKKTHWSQIDILQAAIIVASLYLSPIFILSEKNTLEIISINNTTRIILFTFFLVFINYILNKKFDLPIAYNFSLVGTLILYIFLDFFSYPNLLNKTLLSAIYSGSILTIVTLAFTHGKYKISLKNLGFTKTKSLQEFGFAITVWLVCIGIITVWTYILVEYGEALNLEILIPTDNAQYLYEKTGKNLFLMLIIASLIAPISEELFFRVFIFLGLRNFSITKNTTIAAIISSIFFALSHIDPGTYFITFILGISFCWLYLRTKTILIPIFTHSLHNTISVILIYISQYL